MTVPYGLPRRRRPPGEVVAPGQPTLADIIASQLGDDEPHPNYGRPPYGGETQFHGPAERDTSQEWTPAMQGGSAPAAMREQRPNFGKRLLAGLADYARSGGDFDFQLHDDNESNAGSAFAGGLNAYGQIAGYRKAHTTEQRELSEHTADRSLKQRLIESEILKNSREPISDFPNWQTVETSDGDYVQVNPKSGQTRPVQAPGGGGLHAPHRRDPNAPPPHFPTDDERKLADFGTRILEGHTQMADLENRFPGVAQRVDTKIRGMLAAERVPGVGPAVAAGMQPAVLNAMTPEERAYWGAMQDVGNARLRRVSGATINKEEYDRELRPLVPQLGEDESTLRGKQDRRLQAALLYIRGAGAAFSPDLLSPQARALLGGGSHAQAPGQQAPPPPGQPAGRRKNGKPFRRGNPFAGNP